MNKLSQLCDRYFDLSEYGTIPSDDMHCLKKALQSFLASGKKDDAFVVYFCFSEIFKLFGKGYDNTQKLLETLSDHEYHTGELLTKHRDHYSHSVYVFALGLSIYACDGKYREAFKNFYNIQEGGAEEFLRLWGMSSLFHDIGYPFQLAHEQIKTYVGELWTEGVKPYVTFGNMDSFLAIDDETAADVSRTLNIANKFKSINQLLAYGLEKRNGYDSKAIAQKLKSRVEVQPQFMDHGYFSSVILAKRILDNKDVDFTEKVLDVLTAILLHNSLNKYDIENAHRIKLTEHPLAYLLIVCDELQNWDRLAYGKLSKRDPIAWDAEFLMDDNSITVNYIFESYSIDDYSSGFLKKRPNKSFDEIQDGNFVTKIYGLIESDLKITASVKEKKKNKRTKIYASEDSFINLCDFAKAIHASYDEHCRVNNISHINSDFASLPLEFKVSNIEQAKSYAYKLELINCFYSSKDLDYPIVDDFNNPEIGVGPDNLSFLCREEHTRWVKEKLKSGWCYGVDYTDNEERNAKKIHKDIVPYEVLTKEEQSKDALMVNNIIPLLRRLGNNIKIYSYRAGRKPDLVIAGTGHRYFTDDREALKEQVKQILLRYAKDYRVIVRTCYAAGADLLIAECACDLNLTTKAVIPMEYEDYIQDVIHDGEINGHPMSEEDVMKMRHLLAQTVSCKVVPDPAFVYYEASKYLIEKCDKVIALWDGKELDLHSDMGEPVNRGGTFHCLKIAKDRGLQEGKSIHIINCYR
ncbi:MAG: hypothetical protein K2N23_03630 [Clostridia bacterium]|nr:hypothetical protein [Clostridia bacterium]